MASSVGRAAAMSLATTTKVTERAISGAFGDEVGEGGGAGSGATTPDGAALLREAEENLLFNISGAAAGRGLSASELVATRAACLRYDSTEMPITAISNAAATALTPPKTQGLQRRLPARPNRAFEPRLPRPESVPCRCSSTASSIRFETGGACHSRRDCEVSRNCRTLSAHSLHSARWTATDCVSSVENSPSQKAISSSAANGCVVAMFICPPLICAFRGCWTERFPKAIPAGPSAREKGASGWC